MSKNRTTITIAHRLSTIRKADHIVVMKEGKSIEQGTHDALLRNEGLYHSLISNQQLEMGDQEEAEGTDSLDSQKDDANFIKKRDSSVEDSADSAERADSPVEATDGAHKDRSLINSVGLFLWEQRRFWILYVCILAGAAGCGGRSCNFSLALIKPVH